MLLFLYYQLSIISKRSFLLYTRITNANAASSFLIRETLHSTDNPQLVLGPLNTGILQKRVYSKLWTLTFLLHFLLYIISYIFIIIIIHFLSPFQRFHSIPHTVFQNGLHHHFVTILNVSQKLHLDNSNVTTGTETFTTSIRTKQLAVIITLLSIYMPLYIFKSLYKYLLIKPHKTPESFLFINRQTETETEQLFPKIEIFRLFLKKGMEMSGLSGL